MFYYILIIYLHNIFVVLYLSWHYIKFLYCNFHNNTIFFLTLKSTDNIIKIIILIYVYLYYITQRLFFYLFKIYNTIPRY